MKAPVMIIIGEVVTLADELDWFQKSIDESNQISNLEDNNFGELLKREQV